MGKGGGSKARKQTVEAKEKQSAERETWKTWKTRKNRERERERERGTRARTFKYTYVPTRLFILVAARRIAAEGQDRVNLPLVVYRSQYSGV